MNTKDVAVYLRVSTADQNTDAHEDQVLDFCRKRALGCPFDELRPECFRIRLSSSRLGGAKCRFLVPETPWSVSESENFWEFLRVRFCSQFPRLLLPARPTTEPTCSLARQKKVGQPPSQRSVRTAKASKKAPVELSGLLRRKK